MCLLTTTHRVYHSPHLFWCSWILLPLENLSSVLYTSSSWKKEGTFSVSTNARKGCTISLGFCQSLLSIPGQKRVIFFHQTASLLPKFAPWQCKIRFSAKFYRCLLVLRPSFFDSDLWTNYFSRNKAPFLTLIVKPIQAELSNWLLLLPHLVSAVASRERCGMDAIQGELPPSPQEPCSARRRGLHLLPVWSFPLSVIPAYVCIMCYSCSVSPT